VTPGAEIQIRMTTPKPKPGGSNLREQILHCDRHVVVVRKPVGISSVDHEDEPTSLQEQVRGWLSEQEGRPCRPLEVVHRLDKVTSGVMVFARNAASQAELKDQFRAHTTGATTWRWPRAWCRTPRWRTGWCAIGATACAA
jgi:23S rRNA pseudouridine1911/1915/1917 synthase